MLKKIIIAGLGSLFTFQAFAIEEVFSDEIPLVWQPIITLSGGPAWTSPGLDQFTYNSTLIPLFPTEHYIPNFKTQTIGTGEIFFGLQRVIFSGATGQLGLGLAGAVDPEVSGVVDIIGVPNVYTYTYNIEHARLELKGKLIGNTYRLQPYASASMGIAMNSTHNWTPTTASPLYPLMWYSPDSVAAFAYTLGAGLQFVLSPHWQVGAGYEFGDLGKSYLGPDAATGVGGITLTHLYVNQAIFSLSYVYS
ncbi:MAG: hypothetical protein EPN84_12695 [Legionella sp.]|nr:MAG: hypothetical protein EPN84_12695 [Legionella sp.]